MVSEQPAARPRERAHLRRQPPSVGFRAVDRELVLGVGLEAGDPRASWNGPSVVTSCSPTRVVTRFPGGVVNVTTTSSGPTLMSSAWATTVTVRP